MGVQSQWRDLGGAPGSGTRDGMMDVEFLGGVRTVTGSATLLEKDSFKWLVDCGMFQGGRELEKRNRDEYLKEYIIHNIYVRLV